MSTLKTKVELTSHIVPTSEMEVFGNKILEIQVENHYVTKGMKDIPRTELFLFTPKELEEIGNREMVAVVTKKESGIYTQEVVGYAIAAPSNLLVKNIILNKLTDKIKNTEKDNVFYLIDSFMLDKGENGRAFIRMTKRLEKSIQPPAKVFCPIHAGNKNFEKIIEIFGLSFEYGPEQTVETSVGVIHLPYKLLTA